MINKEKIGKVFTFTNDIEKITRVLKRTLLCSKVTYFEEYFYVYATAQ